MIEEAGKINDYLPASFKTTKESEYVSFLWDAFESNVQSGKFQFAFLAYHMLVMSFVYFNIWQIKLFKPKRFGTALIGFNKNMEKDLLNATSPFVFSVVNERTVLRFLKIIQCDNGKIGKYAKLVDERNLSAHANGNIFFNAEGELERKIGDVLRVVEEIQTHSRDIILEGYKNFLIAARDIEEREYIDDESQIREILINQNYMSISDIAFCCDFDITQLGESDGFETIRILHDTLLAQYDVEEEAA